MQAIFKWMTTCHGRSEPPPAASLFAARAAGITGSPIDASTSLLQRQTHDVVRLAMGSPAAECIPAQVFAAILAEEAGRPDAFDYGPTEGDRALREALTGFLAGHGEEARPEELLITTGGMQGLDLVCKLFVDPGDLVAVESPTYTNGTATITGYQGRIMEVPVDADGMDVEVLAGMAAAESGPPKLIYTIPNFQNPSGTTLSLARRERLLDLADRWGSIVLEDDPYELLRFAGDSLPSLRQLAAGAVRVIGVHTFSKILAPGLRVGWLLADAPVTDLMIAARQGMDTCTNTVQQRLIARFLADGYMRRHLDTLRAEYLRRKQAMHQVLAGEMDGLDASWTDPDGGFFLWLTLPDDLDAAAVFPAALAEGVAYIPGTAFSPGGHFRSALRLAFSAENPSRIRLGVQRLRRAIGA